MLLSRPRLVARAASARADRRVAPRFFLFFFATRAFSKSRAAAAAAAPPQIRRAARRARNERRRAPRCFRRCFRRVHAPQREPASRTRCRVRRAAAAARLRGGALSAPWCCTVRRRPAPPSARSHGRRFARARARARTPAAASRKPAPPSCVPAAGRVRGVQPGKGGRGLRVAPRRGRAACPSWSACQQDASSRARARALLCSACLLFTQRSVHTLLLPGEATVVHGSQCCARARACRKVILQWFILFYFTTLT